MRFITSCKDTHNERLFHTWHNHSAHNDSRDEYQEGRLAPAGDNANEVFVSEHYQPAALQRLDETQCASRDERRVCNGGGGGIGRKMPRNRIRQTEAERREMEARAQTRHQYMARAVSLGPLDYEQHPPVGADPSGTVDIPYKIPCAALPTSCILGSLNAPLCQWANLRVMSPWFSILRFDGYAWAVRGTR